MALHAVREGLKATRFRNLPNKYRQDVKNTVWRLCFLFWAAKKEFRYRRRNHLSNKMHRKSHADEYIMVFASIFNINNVSGKVNS